MVAEPESKSRSPLVGRWTYRSFMADPDIDKDFNDLEFGRGEMLVEYVGPGMFIGRLVFGDTYQLRLEGVVTPGDPPTFRLQGTGDAAESQGQVYEYFGCLMPLWPHDRRQRPTIVGTVIRAAAPGGEKKPKGLASNFIALMQDALPTPTPTTPGATTLEPTTPEPTTPGPTTPGPTTPGPTTPGPATPDPSGPGPSTPEPSNSDPHPPDPSTPGPSTPDPSSLHPHPPDAGHHGEADPYRRT